MERRVARVPEEAAPHYRQRVLVQVELGVQREEAGQKVGEGFSVGGGGHQAGVPEEGVRATLHVSGVARSCEEGRDEYC